MQKLIRKQIMRGVNLTCVPAYKFKTGHLSITLLTQLDKKTVSLNAVLPSVLRRGTSDYPDMESIEAALDELYGARIAPVIRKRGEVQCVGFYSDFIDEEYLPVNDSVLEKTAKLMGNMLLSPATSGGRLKAEYVNGERQHLVEDIKSIINDKRAYSVDRLIESMCRGERYGINKLGTLADTSRITVANLTKQYRELIASSPVEVFYCGAADPERVERAVKDALAALPRTESSYEIPVTDVKLAPKGRYVHNYIEKMDVTQGKLAIGYRIGEAMRSHNDAALMVLNAIFGGTATSRLFLNVREKLSLCYFASTSIDRYQGVMLVSSGIEFDKYDEAFAEITAQLDSLKRGEIEDWELDAARKALISSLTAASDDPMVLEDFYLGRTVSGVVYTPQELAGLIDFVTKEEVTEAAKGIKLDSVYFLTGEAQTDADQ